MAETGEQHSEEGSHIEQESVHPDVAAASARPIARRLAVLGVGTLATNPKAAEAFLHASANVARALAELAISGATTDERAVAADAEEVGADTQELRLHVVGPPEERRDATEVSFPALDTSSDPESTDLPIEPIEPIEPEIELALAPFTPRQKQVVRVLLERGELVSASVVRGMLSSKSSGAGHTALY